MTQQMYDPECLALHQALTAYYRSGLHQVLNKLTSTIWNLAQVEQSLEFLLQCRRHNAIPRFIANSIRITYHGEFMKKLARKLPTHFLQAAIHDRRHRRVQIQFVLDRIWLEIADTITANDHWDRIVRQKDRLHATASQSACSHL